MIEQYRKNAVRRKTNNLPPLPLSEKQTEELLNLLEQQDDNKEFLLDLLANNVEPGVSKSARQKAQWLKEVAFGRKKVENCPRKKAVELLGQMGGGYNVEILIELLTEDSMAEHAATALKPLIKIYDGFTQVTTLAKNNSFAREVLESWARAEWFTAREEIPEEITLTIYKVDGEINTDDFSPGNQAQSRDDIPMHATFFGATRFPDGIETIAKFRAEGRQVGFAGDVVGTGSSRKSAVNSLLWHTGEDIQGVPNKRTGSVIFGGIIAPIFYATARDAGILPVECEIDDLATGDTVIFSPYKWTLKKEGKEIALKPAPVSILDEFRAGGRLNLIIGKQLTRSACQHLGRPFPDFFHEVPQPEPKAGQGYSLAQKMVGMACGLKGVLPDVVCHPKMTTVGSQDTTGPMTIQEIEELACLRFKADLFMQSFCHTAAYPKSSDFPRWKKMQEITVACGGLTLQPGDGVIHSWINKMLLPDTVGTGGDSHTRFPLGISFPAGSGLVAFAAALGFMPLEMPQSVLVRFHGRRRPGITVRDMVNAIPLAAIEKGLLTVEKKGKKNIFAGCILEIEGVEDLLVEEAFELSDASAERSAAACTIKLPLETVIAKISENSQFLKSLIEQGYEDKEAIRRRIADMEKWLKNPRLLEADKNAEYLAVLSIDLDQITEPIVACPNDPDDVKLLSEVADTKIDEVFVGSCMTHLSHLQRSKRLLEGSEYAKSRLWLAPATRMDRDQLKREGGLAVFGAKGGRVETPGCSLCMGNQARATPGGTIVSTSTRNFDNRMGKRTQVYLASTEVTTIAGLLGKLPTVDEYFYYLKKNQLL